MIVVLLLVLRSLEDAGYTELMVADALAICVVSQATGSSTLAYVVATELCNQSPARW
jgi:hypothetical protein